MATASFRVRPARSADLSVLASLVARLNGHPAGRCLRCAPASALGIRLALRDPGLFPGGWERAFVVAELLAADEMFGAFGCQPAPEAAPGFLWGPWLDPAWLDYQSVASSLLEALLRRLPADMPRIDAFLDAENQVGLRFLARSGFTAGPLTHLYVANRSDWLRGEASAPQGVAPLRPAHALAFARLHAETFPAHSSTPALDLLDAHDDEHAILTVADGLRLLGSVCVSVNHAPREGFVEYLAVKPSARGKGVGTKLLQAALNWTFIIQSLPQTALMVSEWRDGAQRLYEKAGFKLRASGIAARRRLR